MLKKLRCFVKGFIFKLIMRLIKKKKVLLREEKFLEGLRVEKDRLGYGRNTIILDSLGILYHHLY